MIFWRNNNTAWPFFLLLPIIATMVCACASKAPVIDRPSVTFRGLTLSKGITIKGNIAIPQEASRTFDTTDNAVVALLSFNNIFGIIKLRWDWFDPNGRLFFSKESKTIKSNEGMYFKEFSAWHVLTIAGDKVEKMPGQWALKIYMNDELLTQKTFFILEKI